MNTHKSSLDLRNFGLPQGKSGVFAAMLSTIMARSYTPQANVRMELVYHALFSLFGASQVCRRMEAVSLLSIAAPLLVCQGGVILSLFLLLSCLSFNSLVQSLVPFCYQVNSIP